MPVQAFGRVVVGSILAAVVMTLPCCSSGVRMMPVPLAVREAGPDPFSSTAPGLRSATVDVFFVTNRAPAAGDSSRARYGSAMAESLRVGTARVRFGPAGWGWEDLVSSAAAGDRPSIKVVGVHEFGVLPPASAEGMLAPAASMAADGMPISTRDMFAAALNERLAGSTHRDVFVYVPGFNLTFELGVRRIAEFSHYLGRDGVFMTFAWPAHSHPFAYGTDRRNARRSVAGFREFLRFLAERTNAERIHLITSSAGAPVVSDVLVAMHEEYPDRPAEDVRQVTRIGEVVYAASDQSVGAFREMLRSGSAAMATHITVYSSSVDMGLLLTRVFGSHDLTIGRLPSHLSQDDAVLFRELADLVTVVDVTDAMGPAGRGDFWAHRYWYLNPWVSGDLLGVLRHRLPPERRGLELNEDGTMWEFPADYVARVRAQMVGCGLTAQPGVGK